MMFTLKLYTTRCRDVLHPTGGYGMTRILDRMTQPADLRGLALPELERLAEEIREQIIDTVMKRGGHFGSNLGVVAVSYTHLTLPTTPYV